MTKRRLLGILAGSVAVASVGTAGALAVAASDDSNIGAPREPVAAVDGLAASLGTFDGERTGADAVPSRLANTLRSAQPGGANVDLARLAFTRGETRGYLVPTDTGICLWLVRDLNDAGGCTTKLPNGPGTTFLDDRPVISGIVGDGVAVVTVGFADGSESKVRTESNTYYLHAPKGNDPTTVTYTTPDGEIITDDVFVPDIGEIERRTRTLMRDTE